MLAFEVLLGGFPLCLKGCCADWPFRDLPVGSVAVGRMLVVVVVNVELFEFCFE